MSAGKISNVETSKQLEAPAREAQPGELKITGFGDYMVKLSTNRTRRARLVALDSKELNFYPDSHAVSANF